MIQAVEDMGKLDNTLIIYISGDNGCSAEGTPVGTPNEVAKFNSVEVPVEDQLKNFYDAWGSDAPTTTWRCRWTWAFDTPFKWTKQIASHFGGTRQGMAISWPTVIKDKGGIRHQFHHVIDVVPTILEAAGIRQPKVVDGIEQSPIEGVSMGTRWTRPTRRRRRRTRPSTSRCSATTRSTTTAGSPARKVSAAVGDVRPGQSQIRPRRHVGAVRPPKGLDAGQRRRRPRTRPS